MKVERHCRKQVEVWGLKFEDETLLVEDHAPFGGP